MNLLIYETTEAALRRSTLINTIYINEQLVATCVYKVQREKRISPTSDTTVKNTYLTF